MNTTARTDVLGSAITCVDPARALELVGQRLADGGGGYVCFTNVHATVTGRQDRAFQAVTNGSFLSLADGKPVYWLARARGSRSVGHVPGPDFMMLALRKFSRNRHFFYGSTPAVLERLTESLRRAIPGLQICGTLSPPFRPLSPSEIEDHRSTIRESGAEFVWVGLGAPKQEFWMAANAPALGASVLFGVGAAFEFHSGTTKRAPESMRRMGLEWLFRLSAEPRRLWKRYLVTNTLFVAYAARESISRLAGSRPPP